jgi:protein involved in polysaccharide export with SLBB domain
MKRVPSLMTGFVLFLSLSVPSLASGQKQPAAPLPVANNSAASTAPILQERNPRYQLRRGDTFDIEFAFSPELNQTATIQPDGYVTAKVIGSLRAEGLTIPELIQSLKSAYAKVLHDPVITIVLKDFEKPYFIAAGQVGRPGKYDLRSDLTITEAVAIAGGFNEKAKHSQVVLFRPAGSDMFETKVIDAKKLLASHDLDEDIHLRPGDMLYVPQNKISRIERLIRAVNVGMYLNPLNY